MDSEKISLLLVEDEPILRLSIQEDLECGGYYVRAASSGQEAMTALKVAEAGMAGLVTDIRLGTGLTGWDIARRAREINPSIAVVYITGDSAQDWTSEGVAGSAILQKPFSEAELLAELSQLIGPANFDPLSTC